MHPGDWAQTTYRLTQRRAARLIPVHTGTLRYTATRDRQDVLRQRLRGLAAVRVRFGYRRLTLLLKREGWRNQASTRRKRLPPRLQTAIWKCGSRVRHGHELVPLAA